MHLGVGKTGNLAFSLLDDNQVEDGKVVVDNASTDGLTLALSSSAWAVAALALRKKELDTTSASHT